MLRGFLTASKLCCIQLHNFVSSFYWGNMIMTLQQVCLWKLKFFISYLLKLDMSTARRRLKSSRSLSGTSAHHIMVTLVNIMVMNWWLTSFSLFISCQSAPPFLRYSKIRLWPWNSKVKVMGVVKEQCHTVSPVSYQLTSFSFHIDQTNNSWDTAISKFDLETSKVKVMSEVKGQGHILYPVSNRCTSFSFHINRTNHSWDMAKIVFDIEKTHPKFLEEICQNNSFQQNCSKI